MSIKTSFYQKILLILFGIFLTLVILEIGLRTGGFILSSLQEHRNLLSLRQKDAYRIMCLGESTTAGQWPPYLEEILNQRNTGIKFSVIDKGAVGIETVMILAGLERNLDRYNPKMVIAMMGINDPDPPYEEDYEYSKYKDVFLAKNKLSLKYFNIYKLAKILYLHTISKVKGIENSEFIEEAIIKKTIRVHYKTDGLYAELDRFYRDQRKLLKAEQPLKEAIRLNPKSDGAYLELGRLYRVYGEFIRGEQVLKKSAQFNPGNGEAYLELALCYQGQGKIVQAEQALKRAIELNPENLGAYSQLGWFYRDQGKIAQAEQSFKKAIELNPKNEGLYYELALFYRDQGKIAQAEQSFKKAIELNPNSEDLYYDLALFYRDQKRLAQAEQALKRAIELNPDNDRLYRAMATLYVEMGKEGLPKEYYGKASRLRSEDYKPITIHNYQLLKKILDRKKIKLVCVAYPLRSIEPLKKIFKEKEDIIFVDNERVFKEALKKTGYRDYFIDTSAGDFGHCTDKGNYLLAENIANTILKEVFGASDEY